MLTFYEIDRSSWRFKPVAADRPFVSAVASTNAPVKNSRTDLRFLDRDRANRMVLLFGEGAFMSQGEFNWEAMRFLGADIVIGSHELKEFIYENRSQISRACDEYDSV